MLFVVSSSYEKMSCRCVSVRSAGLISLVWRIPPGKNFEFRLRFSKEPEGVRGVSGKTGCLTPGGLCENCIIWGREEEK